MSGNKRNKGRTTDSLATIYCLTGCTAVGKTEYALSWAEAFDAEIVNCDSLLFYRGMDIGTAKPDASERARVPHHLIDILEPSVQMDVGQYLELAKDVIREIQARGKRVLVVGGSGFYLKAFFEPVVDAVEVSIDTKAKVSSILEEGLSVAVAELQSRNPMGLGNLDIENPRRVQKALERCLESGKTLQQLKREFAGQSNSLIEADKQLCILTRETEELNERIASRVGIMLDMGLVEEVERLLDRGIEENPSACRSIGYRETIAYIKGEYDQAQLVERITVNTRRLAKKQRTWFRGQVADRGRYLDLSADNSVSLAEIFSGLGPGK